jgi:autotransporter-associated beta strand protein
LVLNGVNTYAGGTAIEGGTVRASIHGMKRTFNEIARNKLDEAIADPRRCDNLMTTCEKVFARVRSGTHAVRLMVLPIRILQLCAAAHLHLCSGDEGSRQLSRGRERLELDFPG